MRPLCSALRIRNEQLSKVVSVILTVISGFYGMNFERTWPPFQSDYGILFVLALMIAVLYYSTPNVRL